MAKRKRLTPPRPDYMSGPGNPPTTGGMSATMPPPISHIAGDAATTGALREVAEEMTAARKEGRLLLRLPLDAIDETWLVRDRVGGDPEALDSLLASLRSHGQRNPVEVTETAPGRYGLISGWRRLSALRQLQGEAPDDPRFATVLALPRKPDTAEDAYVAMIEENEIRLGLSYFERARIAAKAVEAGVFPTEKIALQKLYASASRAKRSKIGSFLRIYHALQDHLSFASALPERLGLTLSRALDDDPQMARRLSSALARTAPKDAEAEQAILVSVLDAQQTAAPTPKPAAAAPTGQPKQAPGGIVIETARPASATLGGKVVLTGNGLTPEVLEKLRKFLEQC